MFHLSYPGTFLRRSRLISLLFALLLVCGALFSLAGTASAATVPDGARAAGIANKPHSPKSVVFANHNWNCVDAACTKRVKAGQFQKHYECAEFVARSLAAAGFIPGLRATSPQSAYDPYKPGNGKTYDLLLITPGLAGPHVYTLAAFLLDYGYVKNIHQNLKNAEPGDIVVFRDKNGVPQHTGIIVSVSSGKHTASNTLLDLHNRARYHVSIKSELGGEFPSKGWYILHIQSHTP